MIKPEELLARAVVSELQRQGFETYEEVSMGQGAHRADIVGVRGPVVAVVECKAKMSLKFLDQLLRWRGGAHLIIGAHGWSRSAESAKRLCQLQGFGLWSVLGDEISVYVEPQLHRRAGAASLRKRLRAEHQSAEYAKAGTMGGYWTPFRQTASELLRLVKEKPGITLKDAMGEMKHHYANNRSACSSIPALITRGVVVGIRMERDGKSIALYPS